MAGGAGGTIPFHRPWSMTDLIVPISEFKGPQLGPQRVPGHAIWRLKNVRKRFSGFAPDPSGGAYSAPQTP